MRVVTRFAPSPTGRLHLGHAYSAIQGHDFARAHGGRFVLRIEDSDAARCRPEHVTTIVADLEWLGLGWDEMIVQSARLALYDQALERLKAMGAVYPCFCSRADIAREIGGSVQAPHGADGPLYPGLCRDLADDERAARVATEPHSWRLDARAALARCGALWWHDDFAGTHAADIAVLGDLIIKGRDRPASYHLAVVVDDAAQGVTHVTRGRDLLASTHTHRLLQGLLGLAVPVYRHHALIGDENGVRLAKRGNAPTLAALRADGADGPALAAELRSGLPTGFTYATP